MVRGDNDIGIQHRPDGHGLKVPADFVLCLAQLAEGLFAGDARLAQPRRLGFGGGENRLCAGAVAPGTPFLE